MTDTKDWIFCSSGARASHLRGNVTNLALPPGEIVQFRYKANIISSAFISLMENSPQSFKGHSAYLTYLDNREKGIPPKFFPLREASIVSAHKRGSTYIIKLKLGKYVNWLELDPNGVEDLLDTDKKASQPGCRQEGLQEDESIKWKGNGKWVFEALPDIRSKLINHDPQNKSHLSSFEAAVEACFTGKDFADAQNNWIFCNFYGPKERDTYLKEKVLKAGKAYNIPLFHYKPGSGSHGGFDPFVIKITSNNDNVEFTGSNQLKIESAYDEKVIHFRVKRNTPRSSVTFNINVFCDRGTHPQVVRHNCLDFDVSYKIQPAIKYEILGILGIAGGLFVAQVGAFYSSDDFSLNVLMFVAIGSLIAGYSAFSTSKKS